MSGNTQLLLEADWDTFCAIEAEITHAETNGVTARWRCGRMLLRYNSVPGSRDSPLAVAIGRLSGELGVSPRELYNRRQLAEEYEDEEKLCHALQSFGSWHEMVAGALGQRRQPRTLPPPPALPDGVYPIIYCDPPWRYEFAPTPSRAIENQYPTLSLDEIKALDVPAADQAVLFMWATSPKLEEALEVVRAWGFLYRTNMAWVKDRIGMGYYVRQQHETLLIAKRGDFPLPDESALPPSIVHAPRTRHSAKPAEFYEIIERLYPGYPRVELFARNSRAGWDAWGNEAPVAA